MIKQIRRQTFSHWQHRRSPFQTQMIKAGFFYCNVGDRVICIYCNLICQEWTPHTDDPCEVHKTLSPKCPFVVNMLVCREVTPRLIINQSTETNGTQVLATANVFHSHEIVLAAACNPSYMEIPKRHQSFTSWPSEPLPSVDDLVRAGFFYTGIKTIVTCFYCNGSLQNWGTNDNPTVEHARWFPQCAYAKQLCGDELYRKIQESKRVAQERARANEPTNNITSNTQKLTISDERTLSRLVAARLDLPISQKLLDQHFKLSVIKRCWEDQLRLKLDDFVTDCDLVMACIILQRQIDCINGKKENIIVPSVKMRQMRDPPQSDTVAAQSPTLSPATLASAGSSNSSDVEIITSSGSSTTESSSRTSVDRATAKTKISNTTSMSTNSQLMQTANSDLMNPCALFIILFCATFDRYDRLFYYD
ncbi:unnamed protein product [Rotaria sordida]|uniref:Uncharacterized protein n=1 Tax=Rotaria sordida TaxID=392033 RepID=A0A815DWJ4_9BILA|nr:unnamed protein product [Rotaria sordida]CAF1304034.1 unnamed protein product [Rotaria sordida]